MRKVLGTAFLFVFIFFAIGASVYAAEITYENTSTQLGIDEELQTNLTLTINAPDGTIYYLRGVFSKKDSSNYCGYTFNGENWFSGPYSTNEGWKNFLFAEIHDNKWQGTLRAKIDNQDSGCLESGEYEFKVQRFTSSSGNGSFDSQIAQMVFITVPTPTSTPTPTSAPTNTPIPTKKPSNTPTPKKAQPVLPLAEKVDAKESDMTKDNLIAAETKDVEKEVLSQSTSRPSLSISEADESKKTTISPSVTEKKEVAENSTIPLVFIVSGTLLLIAACGILLRKSLMSTVDAEDM